ncbi:MAG: outer membrane protein transport protein, partial [Planctomycetales bacterium]|nr:outer membrane protein transport protein [Planctomycetales bacterium]
FNWALLSIAPFSLANPNLDGSYPSGTHADAAWGIGFQIGAYFQSCASPWSFGFSYKSPQWFDDFKINSVDNLGQYRQVTGKLDYPSIVALGMGYHGFTRTKLAVDVRYIDYENTDGFEPARFAADGSVTGFGWSSIWVVATGVEFALTESWRWRFGYTFNQSPIDHSTMFYSSPSPALTQHHLSTGFSVDTPGGWTCHMAYHYGFKNSVSGNWWHPSLGQVPGTRVTGSLATHGLLGGVSRRF